MMYHIVMVANLPYCNNVYRSYPFCYTYHTTQLTSVTILILHFMTMQVTETNVNKFVTFIHLAYFL